MKQGAIGRVAADFDAFCRRVEEYRQVHLDQRQGKDRREAAYEGLYKFFQRVEKEVKTASSATLSKVQRAACHAILQDRFLLGLLQLRTVATHIRSETGRKRGSIPIQAPSGAVVEISGEVTADAVFSQNVVHLSHAHGPGVDAVDHLKNLEAAESRIRRHLQSADRKD